MQDLLGRAPARRYAQRLAEPARLWVQAMLHGYEPPPLERARVLELGCGDGGHLLGIAARHPGMQVVGLDPRSAAIAEGQQLADRAGIANLRLEVGELSALAGMGEAFDYVICEGVYSRANEAERGQLLAGIARLLSERGLACLEYDVRPLFRVHELVADLLRRSLAHRGVEVTSQSARGELELLLEAGAAGRGVELLRSELEAWRLRDDDWLLAELRTPRQGVMFDQLMQSLGPHGLHYAGEASYWAGRLERLPEAGAALAEREVAPLRREQYVDFFSGRRQRRSLLTRHTAPAARAGFELLARLSCVSWLRVADDEFVVPGGAKLRIEDPLHSAVVRAACASWPEALSAVELVHRAAAEAPGAERDELARAVLEAHDRDWLELRHAAPGYVGTPGKRPRMSSLARVEALSGRLLTNVVHAPIQLGGGVAGALASWLDGEHDRGALRARLLADGFPPQQCTQAAVEQILNALGRRGLLLPEERS